MKKTVLVVIVLFAFGIYRANAQAFEAGTNVLSAGIGLGSTLGDYSFASESPGFSIQYDRGIWEAGPGVISLGGYLGFKSYSYGTPDYSEKWHYTIIGARGAWHWTEVPVENLDVYGGVMLSYDNLSYSVHDYNGNFAGNNYGSGVYLSPYVGGKYYFAGNLAGYAELGFGVSILNIGLAYKF